jgi:CYTH domain-containing protein/CHAD domain-containing protein
MAKEIERKFRIGEAPGWLSRYEAKLIRQGYLAVSDNREVRLREVAGEHVLAVKEGHGLIRREVEIQLDPDQFAELWPLTESRRLLKARRQIPIGPEDKLADVDIYKGDLEGLVVAEIEFASEAESEQFEVPDWLGAEVTGDQRYSNQSLAAGSSRPPEAAHGNRDQASKPRIPSASRAYRLKNCERTRNGIRRIALGRSDHALERLSKGETGDLDSVIHASRKDLKKLRAVLRLVRPSLDQSTYEDENRRYRNAGRLLSAARDAEIKLETLSSLQSRYGENLSDRAISGFRSELKRDRKESNPDIETATEVIAAGRATLLDLAMKEKDWKLIGPGITRSYRRARKEMKMAMRAPSAENVHAWRKRSKDFWYHLRVIRRVWPTVVDEIAESAHELADLLGDHHDLWVLAEDAGQRSVLFEEPWQAAHFFALIRMRQDELLDAALGLGTRLFAEKPKAFERRMRIYWRAPPA